MGHYGIDTHSTCAPHVRGKHHFILEYPIVECASPQLAKIKENVSPLVKQSDIVDFLHSSGPLLAVEVAEYCWPDSPGWQKSKQVGNNGSSMGAGMVYPAQMILGRLKKAGSVRTIYPLHGNTRWVCACEECRKYDT